MNSMHQVSQHFQQLHVHKVVFSASSFCTALFSKQAQDEKEYFCQFDIGLSEHDNLGMLNIDLKVELLRLGNENMTFNDIFLSSLTVIYSENFRYASSYDQIN